jgi:hypothetical protein
MGNKGKTLYDVLHVLATLPLVHTRQVPESVWMWWQGQKCLPQSIIQLLLTCNRTNMMCGSALESQATQISAMSSCCIKLTGSYLKLCLLRQYSSLANMIPQTSSRITSLNMITLTGNCTWNSAHVQGPPRHKFSAADMSYKGTNKFLKGQMHK